MHNKQCSSANISLRRYNYAHTCNIYISQTHENFDFSLLSRKLMF